LSTPFAVPCRDRVRSRLDRTKQVFFVLILSPGLKHFIIHPIMTLKPVENKKMVNKWCIFTADYTLLFFRFHNLSFFLRPFRTKSLETISAQDIWYRILRPTCLQKHNFSRTPARFLYYSTPH
jgi:hypothetical protein